MTIHPTRRKRATRTLGLAAAVVTLAVGGCKDGPTAPTCVAAQPFAPGAIAHLTPAMLRLAITDVAQRAAPVVLGTAEAGQLQTHLTAVGDGLEVARAAACRAVGRARARLNEVPDDPAARPDRAALVLVLDLAESYLAAAGG